MVKHTVFILLVTGLAFTQGQVGVPGLSISTNLLVVQYKNRAVIGGESPRLVCTPSDPEAPVRWSTTPSDLIERYGVTFSPQGLNHVVSFPAYFERMDTPYVTAVFTCDLINTEQPNTPVNPQSATVRFIENPVAILKNDIELKPGSIINNFTNPFSNLQQLNLRCVGTQDHGELQWETRNVERFPDILDDGTVSSSEGLTIEYLSFDKRDTTLMLQTIATDTVGDYMCRSRQSGYTTGLYTTLQDPYFMFTSPVEQNYSVPLGANVTFSAEYAYSSNGSHNYGPGYRRSLQFIQGIEGSLTLDGGMLADTSNKYEYIFSASMESSGIYILEFESTANDTVLYASETELEVTVPYLAYYEPDVIVQQNKFVTLECIPNDLRAPVLWRLGPENYLFLHYYTSLFDLSPPSLRHTVTFNASHVKNYFEVVDLQFSCGFKDGDNEEYIVNVTSLSVTVQEEKMRLEHQSNHLKIFNNTVINYYFRNFNHRKRGAISPSETGLSIDCLTSQGDHLPFWFTTNIVLGGDGGVVQEEGQNISYGQEILSNYVARLSFQGDSFYDFYEYDYYYLPDGQFEGTYRCVSAKSGLSQEFFFTADDPYVSHVSPAVINVIEGSSVKLEFKIAVQSDGNSWIEDGIEFTFTPSGLQEIRDEQVQFTVADSDFPQNWVYYIPNVDRVHDGVYTARASFGEIMETNEEHILLQVTKRCLPEVNSGIQWQQALENTTVSRPCSDAGSMFRDGPMATRKCNKSGEWEEADLSSCTLVQLDEPFLLAWFVLDADTYTNAMEEIFVQSMEDILEENGVVYYNVSLQSAHVSSSSVSATFRVDLADGNQTEHLMAFDSFLHNIEAFSMFSNYRVIASGRGLLDITSAETCSCSTDTEGIRRVRLCSGAAISPCSCNASVCECQSPFVGDGLSCTLDSDNDGYPDQPLDSPSCAENSSLAYCNADVCPEIRNPDQDRLACQPVTAGEVFTGCPYGLDLVWQITWPNTPVGSTSIQPCPGGVDSIGSATRFCGDGGIWNDPVVLECQSLEILRVEMEAATLPGSDEAIENVTAELLERATTVTAQLTDATVAKEVSLLPLDLNSTNNIVAQVINILESGLGSGIAEEPDKTLVDVFDNVLNEANEDGWLQLQTVDSGSQSLLRNTERYGVYLASAVNDTSAPAVLARNNIVLSAQMVDPANVSDIVFPSTPQDLANFTAGDMDTTAQISIPTDALSIISGGRNGTVLPVAHILFRNIEQFLPSTTTKLNNTAPGSLVLSSQVGRVGNYPNLTADNFANNPVTLNFTFMTGKRNVADYECVFWDFSLENGRGGWVSEGLEVVSNKSGANLTTVECNSTHLTNFAVLVDVAGGLEDAPKEELLALQIVSYIGCGISSFCLILTIIFYLCQGKKLFNAVHYFVHLNLALSLLLGYVVFMAGIELGTRISIVCTAVAALLQYLFLSAFCWMMCEGVMLYLMLVVVFSKLAKKWWFFLLIGYLTPLPFVAAGLGLHRDYYHVTREDGEVAFCWLSTEKYTIYFFAAPAAAILIINFVFLLLALSALLKSKRGQRSRKMEGKTRNFELAKATAKAVVILLPLLGITWAFGVLTLNRNTTVFAWLFTVFNSLQGAAIFFFHVVRSETVWGKVRPRLSTLRERSTVKSSLSYEMQQSQRRGTKSANEVAFPGRTSTMKESLLATEFPPKSEYEVMQVPDSSEEGKRAEKERLAGIVNPLPEKLPYTDGDDVVANPTATTEYTTSVI